MSRKGHKRRRKPSAGDAGEPSGGGPPVAAGTHGRRSAAAARWLDRAALALVALVALALALHRLIAYDVWWQLATGARVLAEGWPHSDPFSYLVSGLPWIEMRWLYCVAAHLLFTAGGVNLLIVAKTAAVAAALTLLAAARLPGAPRWPTLVGLALAVATGHPRWLVRPEMVSYVLVAWTLLALERYRRGGARSWLLSLPAIQLLWVNSHTLFILGPVLQGLFVAGEWLGARRWSQGPSLERRRLRLAASTAAVSALVCLINPYGLAGALFPFQLFSQIQEGHRLSSTIAEFRSPFAVFDLLYLTVPYLVTAAVAAAALLLRRRRQPLSRPLTWLAFLYLSTLAHRNLALFGLVSGFVVVWGLGEWAAETTPAPAARRRRRRVGWAARLAVVALAATALPWVASDAYPRATGRLERLGLGVSRHRFPAKALELVRREGLPRPVVGKLGDSGYVLFVEGERSVLVDGRLEVYGRHLMPALRRLESGNGWSRWTAELGVDTAIVLHREQTTLLAALEALPDWLPVYFDALHVVYVRRTAATAAAIDRLEVDWSRPRMRPVTPPPWAAPADPTAGLWPRVADPEDDAALAQLFLNVGNPEAAERHLRSALAAWPGHRDAALALGLVLEARGDQTEAERWLARAGRRARRPEALRTRALLMMRAGRPAEALAVYRRLLERDAERPGDWADAGRAALAAGEPAAAEELLAEATGRFGGAADLWSLRGLAAKAAGRPAEALGHFRRALERNPDDPSLLNEVGIAHAMLGDRAAARRAFEAALAADPGYAPARGNLLRLR